MLWCLIWRDVGAVFVYVTVLLRFDLICGMVALMRWAVFVLMWMLFVLIAAVGLRGCVML